jgi:flagellar basal-body rod modification protein FlgD
MDAVQTQTPVRTQATPPVVEKSKTNLNSDYETFLKMLTTQAKNQDPLDPLDSSEYAAQLAAFSSVEQQVTTNDLLATMISQLGAMSMAQLSGWVGMEARAAAPAYFDGDPVQVAPNPHSLADDAMLVVYDANDAEVQRYSIGTSSDTINWNGVADDGSTFANGLYSFQVESYAEGELLSTDQAEIYSRITEARGENGDTVLVLEGGANVSANSVTALREANSGITTNVT